MSRNPTTLGALLLTTAALLAALGLGGLGFAARAALGHAPGPDGAAVLADLQRFALWFALQSAALGLLLRDTGGLRRRLGAHLGAHWPVTAASAVLGGLCLDFYLCAKLVQSNLTRQGLASTYYDHALLFGRHVEVTNEPFSIADLWACLGLLLAAALAYAGLWRRLLAPDPIPARLWALMALGLAWVGLDEYFGWHEFLGANLPFLRGGDPNIYRDDVILVIYSGCAGIVALLHGRALLSRPLATAIFVVGTLLHTVAVVADSLYLWPNLEESLEVCAAMLYAIGVAHLHLPPRPSQA